MGMDLMNAAGETARFKCTAWCTMLKLAYLYGWEPRGTEWDAYPYRKPGEPETAWKQEIDGWDGNYTSNGCQLVTKEDAAGIADALEGALEDVPDSDVGETRVKYGPKMVYSGPGVPTGLLEFFSGAGKQDVRAFVAFCRVGAFRIT